jgi:ssDNA thymidine ADP-ribosyltransferase, DarT/Macro domain
VAPQRKKFGWPDVHTLFYITHVDNLESILQHGILSHAERDRRALPARAIYNEEVVNRRKNRLIDGRSLWEFANLYFEPKNPMLYQVLRGGTESNYDNIVLLAVSQRILETSGSYVAAGNAAADATQIFSVDSGEREIGLLQKVFQQEYWNGTDGSKRTIMAEFLSPISIAPSYISAIYVAKPKVKELIDERYQKFGLDVIVEPHKFFLPRRSYRITPALSLADGDMFFSRLQTLTVSVNTVGIMGKGLASRAKYQFPDVYVRYQDLCRRKTLKMGKPALYKRDFEQASVDCADVVDGKWFLLFPTKDHWKNDSEILPIEEGLEWLVANYKKEGIESLAIPALGCGLGNLDWKEVGPLMCRYLAKLEIKCAIYLPQGREIPPEYTTPQYLLNTS